ncbi:TKL protein kinase [Saprolegnia parasitica CBS 223.65]|uniref:TKL protein kinase n=1 Tax=Saprolegnia parasitica (strain CBS 223.65) TaxID=695850 RepID=A0A067C4K1_SAPPC|nr:TKL protein kinase [Saprolegnia parasitica CBS 223.65]KDO21712.1 TKL protein kinase [Saprolegnia parasitica CBS 223.65]|eukprot:XP_012207515.1 TKL protein kinase [Saprolegnia parasitica CBS 223.65]
MAESPRQLVKLELPPGARLGVAITPPTNGVTNRGLKIDKVLNELFFGRISHGDLLVEIGGTPLDGMTFADAVNLIKTKPRPLALTFEIAPAHEKTAASAEDLNLPSYNVVFDDAKMGINLEAGARFGVDGAIVKGVRDFAEESGIASGDILYKVNGTEVLFMSLKQVQNLIKATLPPRSLDFIPNTILEEVQLINLSMSVIEKNARVGRAGVGLARTPLKPEKSITEIIQENRLTVIKEGPLYQLDDKTKIWKACHVVLAVTKLEYFKDARDKTVQGVVNFVDCLCTVRSLPSTSANLMDAHVDYVLELEAGDRKLIMACLFEEEKVEWLEALKVAIDASKTLQRASLVESTQLERSSRMPSILEEGINGTLQSIPEGQEKPLIASTTSNGPTVDIEILSIQTPAKASSQMNLFCEVTLGSETFKTSVVTASLNPQWTKDNKVTFDVPGDDDDIEIRVYDERMYIGPVYMSVVAIPIASLPNKTTMKQTYALIPAARSAKSSITLSLRYNNAKLDQEKTSEPEYEVGPPVMTATSLKTSKTPDIQETLHQLPATEPKDNKLGMLKAVLQRPEGDINKTDELGYTALARAVLAGQDHVVNGLLKRGADAWIPLPMKLTTLAEAVKRGHRSMARVLYDRMYPGPITMASMDGITDLSLMTRQAGSDVDLYRATYRGKTVVLKGPRYPNTRLMNLIHNEVHEMQGCTSPYVQPLLAVIDNGSHEPLITIPDCGALMTLKNARYGVDVPLPVSTVQVALVLAKALADLHRLGKVHRDVKSLNIFLSTEHYIRLGDLGSARTLDDSMSSNVGTKLWIAPEVHRVGRSGSGPGYSTSADIYSFGVVLTELDTREMPYADMADKDVTPQQVRDGKLRPKMSDNCKPWLRALADQCLELNPAKRPTAEAIIDVLTAHLHDDDCTSICWIRSRRLSDTGPRR